MSVDPYIDNLHKQLYVRDSTNESGVSTGNSTQLEIGLSDIAELPGQSTWFIRSIKFYCSGYQDALGVAPDTRIRVLGGVMNRDISGDMGELEDYQDIAGWPLNKVCKDLIVENTPAQNFFSFQYTYTPRKALTLNREQDIIFCVKNVYGNDMTFQVNMYVHAERGD